ncbi:hypothetical protein CEUSTIGMA_g7970.t1 [Chlamydomonas eustigma]|uniref:S1 motif domain-containing protein n=1 Tax=Chlamydomonas eustigma TaxID=1157962 RepID=A0A250XCE3_9CHLO|nr:hypothetical protein CEUSTIGMA_g7970.t1 [Chlamydomonas eustigma]|eukprot:GAX80532.1 hypothetical protein CEUSTIGMA_g7970.t1 [Chlamydomonas eustigma]
MPPNNRSEEQPKRISNGRKRLQAASKDQENAPKNKKGSINLSDSGVTVDDGDFPRGGGDGLTHLERREVFQEAKKEFDAEVEESSKSKTRNKKGSKKLSHAKSEDDANEDSKDSFLNKNEGSHAKGGRYVELLKAKNLSVGMKVWGILLEVAPRGLTVSLPHGLRGHVVPSEASDYLFRKLDKKRNTDGQETSDIVDLSKLFHVGQFVRCTVVGLPDRASEKTGGGATKTPGKAVQLSLRLKKLCEGLGVPSLQEGAVVPAAVQSAEDHGYTLDLGIKGVTAFLQRKHHESVFGEGSALLPGMLLEVAVLKSVSTGGALARAVPVSTDPALVSSTVVRESEVTSLDSLLPGSLINAKVKEVLSDGLMLSFLTFFHGTVDPFHLSDPLAAAAWRRGYSEGQKLKVRILYIDPITKQAGLSILPHLVGLTLPSPTPMLGQLFQEAKVRRVHAGLGLLLELPLDGEERCAGFVHISNLNDGREDTPMEKLYKVGQTISARVIGFRLVDGLATLSMKKSVLDQEIVSYAHLHPGMPLSTTINCIEDHGLLVSAGPGIKGLIPKLHASDLGTSKALTKFKVGQKVSGKVLEVDVAARRMTLTLKPGLLGSKLQCLASKQQLAPGLRTHGMITGVQDYGVFVSFYGGISGLAHVGELGLPDGVKPAQMYNVGQVVKAIVLAIEPASGRLKLSLAGKKSAAGSAGELVSEADPYAGFEPGDVAEASVLQVVGEGDSAASISYIVEVTSAERGGVSARAKLEAVHFADHPAAVEALRSVIKPGAKLGKVVVLERSENGKKKHLLVSRKSSLVLSASALPSSFDAVKEGALLPGFVVSITPDAVFVRFLGHVTGRAGLSQLADTFVTDPKMQYAEGQSVRAQVVQVDAERKRFSLTLKPSLTCSTDDALYLSSLFADLELVHHLKHEGELREAGAAGGVNGNLVDWGSTLAIGAAVSGRVHGVEEYGVVVDLNANEDLVGIIRQHQLGDAVLRPRHPVSTRILDVSKSEGILDLTAAAPLVEGAKHQAAASASASAAAGDKKASQKLKGSKKGVVPAEADSLNSFPRVLVGDRVEAVVELVKETLGYVILSLPEKEKALAFAAITDYNLKDLEHVSWKPLPGQRIHSAVVAALPCTANGGRLLLKVSKRADVKPTAGKQVSGSFIKEAGVKKQSRAVVGALVSGLVTAVHLCHLDVQVGKKLMCRLHMSEIMDLKDSNPLPTSSLLAIFRVQQPIEAVVLGRLGGESRAPIDLSMRPSLLKLAKANDVGDGDNSTPAWLPKSLTLSDLSAGAWVTGLVQEVAEDHLWVSLSPSIRGRVSALDVSTDPLALADLKNTFHVGEGVRGRVLQVDVHRRQLDLTLITPEASGSTKGTVVGTCSPLQPGDMIMGRVVAVAGSGIKVHIGHKRYGIISMTDLHDEWVDNALLGVTKGSYARCKVISALDRKPPTFTGAVISSEESQAFLLSVRPSYGGCLAGLQQHIGASVSSKEETTAKAQGGHKRLVSELSSTAGLGVREVLDVASLKIGSKVQGYVKAVGSKGLFLALDRIHDAHIRIRNLSDGFVEDPAAAFPEGMRVEASVVSIKDGRLELSLRTVDPNKKASLVSLSDLAVGQIVSGRVRRVEAYGVFVDVVGCNTAGLAHVSELSDGKVKEVAALYRQGQAVRAKVLKVDLEKGKLSLGLKPSYLEGDDGVELEPCAKKAKFTLPDIDGEAVDMEEGEDDEEEDEGEEDEDEDMKDVDDVSEEENTEMDEQEDEQDAQYVSQRSRPGEASGRIQKPGMDGIETEVPVWGGLLLQDGVGGDNTEEGKLDLEDKTGKKLSKHAKKKAKEEHESQIREAEAARLHGDAAPKTAQDFEKLVASSPNSSYVWIKYMAYQISIGDIDNARKVAERALQSINYREEGEKFNVWIALLNLENAYGQPPEDAFTKLFQRALQYCDQKKLYFAALGIADRSSHKEMASNLLKAMSKKFSSSAKVWLRSIESHLISDEGEKARLVLERALQSLPKRKHIKVITHAALLEFKVGSAERGRGILEGVLRNYPKRLDLWSVYIDQEVKLGDQQRIRALFERATQLQLPPKKMRFLFTRYLEYEEEHGDAAGVANVKKLAMEFVLKAAQG